jgi:putative ABC transport system substrate-binding protein
MRRRDFITLLGAAAAWPLAARAQQRTLPMIGYLDATNMDLDPRMPMFRQGLGEAGFIEGRNVAIEYRSANGQYSRLPALAAELVRRQVDVIVAPGSAPAALAAKAATATIPVVFGVADDPVKLGLVTSFARPEGNVTGVDIFSVEVVAKRLSLLHALVPKAARIAVLVNPANTQNGDAMVGEISRAASAMGLQIELLKAGAIGEIDAAFAALTREHADALFVAPDAFFFTRRAQFVTLSARYAIPAAYFVHDFVEAGGLMSYGTDVKDSWRQVGIYAGRILKGVKPADLPVMQSSKFEFTINLHTARLLGIEVPPSLLAIADEVVE